MIIVLVQGGLCLVKEHLLFEETNSSNICSLKKIQKSCKVLNNNKKVACHPVTGHC